ncbi:hypothetical protein CXF68_12310 [Tenacibaculum sp. Bg11-29]|uniref:hypothetical protein n=1 Tax=Tenacibaculum sp. Bg11-29 TaxID=2058306 RepID=UPI000C340977|nr:hypothetical protein [Tenacibaculum sp. Bg11-29]PKH51415.1 hypothetical protein CXF68_12310 [Tenacibaculum sp. Bg11-29]
MESQINYPKLMGTKKELANHYWKLSSRFFRNTINRIISESRNIPLGEAKRLKTITPREFKLFVAEIDGI